MMSRRRRRGDRRSGKRTLAAPIPFGKSRLARADFGVSGVADRRFPARRDADQQPGSPLDDVMSMMAWPTARRRWRCRPGARLYRHTRLRLRQAKYPGGNHD